METVSGEKQVEEGYNPEHPPSIKMRFKLHTTYTAPIIDLYRVYVHIHTVYLVGSTKYGACCSRVRPLSKIKKNAAKVDANSLVVKSMVVKKMRSSR